MSAIQGQNVAAPVVPFDTQEEHATHIDQYGKGGYRVVADAAARDAIPADRRSVGMLIKRLDTGAIERLDADETWSQETIANFADGGGYVRMTDAERANVNDLASRLPVGSTVIAKPTSGWSIPFLGALRSIMGGFTSSGKFLADLDRDSRVPHTAIVDSANLQVLADGLKFLGTKATSGWLWAFLGKNRDILGGFTTNNTFLADLDADCSFPDALTRRIHQTGFGWLAGVA